MNQLSYLEIRKQVPLMKRAPGARVNLGKIAILSNIMVNQLHEILDYTLLQNGLEADEIVFTEYDTIVQSSAEVADATAVFVFWEVCNLVDGFQYKAEYWDNDKTEELLDKTRGEIDYVMNALAKIPVVYFNLFSGQAFSASAIASTAIDDCAARLNQHLERNLPANVTIVDIHRILAGVSIAQACDYRFFYSSKCLYTAEFFIAYARQVVGPLLSLKALSKKALILDCDNTLWQGIVGEDGVEAIQFPPAFLEVQAYARALAKQGVVIGLCSKNNPEDVVEVFEKRDEMILREEDLTIRRVNWQDKATNLREMAAELNIGIDSFVFIDDSAFECDLVRSHVPEITVYQRPENLAQYPGMVSRLRAMFMGTGLTDEDRRRRDMYKQEAERTASKVSFSDIADYIRSLELRVTIAQDCQEHLPRASQLTQKTNQFNLTTRRYTENEITDIQEEGGGSTPSPSETSSATTESLASPSSDATRGARTRYSTHS